MSELMMIDLEIWDEMDDDISEIVSFPAHWVVCGDCRGNGSYPDRRISPTGDGSWTQSEMAEAGPDFREEYFGGKYDITCQTCKGRTTIKAIDMEALDENQRKLFHQWEEQEYERMADDRMMEAERRFGC